MGRKRIRDDDYRVAYNKYLRAKRKAKERGIEWSLLFPEWWKFWIDSGYWEERGRLGYHMCRKLDLGPYAIDNIYIAHYTENYSDNLKFRHLKAIWPHLCNECKDKIIASY